MFAAALAAALLLSSAEAGAAHTGSTFLSAQQAVEPADSSAIPVTDLDEIVVEGRRLEEMTRDFVREVGAPARGRGLARWDNGVCVGVANLQGEAAQYIVDRVSTVAEDIGLKVGAPGCEPSILIIASADSSAFTRQLVASRPRLFSGSGAGMDLGYAALRDFQSVDRPVRWWNVSAPIDSETGQIAVRTRGMLNGGGTGVSGDSPMNFAPTINSTSASRLSTQIVETTKRVFVVIDVDKVSQVSLPQLADYLAMVTMAQIDPDADTSGYATVLNLFDEPARTEGLTEWDKAYLKGLYDAIRTRRNDNSSRAEIVASIVDVRRDMLTANEPEHP